jgi:hypothetical protein
LPFVKVGTKRSGDQPTKFGVGDVNDKNDKNGIRLHTVYDGNNSQKCGCLAEQKRKQKGILRKRTVEKLLEMELSSTSNFCRPNELMRNVLPTPFFSTLAEEWSPACICCWGTRMAPFFAALLPQNFKKIWTPLMMRGWKTGDDGSGGSGFFGLCAVVEDEIEMEKGNAAA